MTQPRPQEPATKREAEEMYLNQPVKKYFEPDEEEGFEGGWFTGKVAKVEAGLRDENKQMYPGLLFLIRYDDGDEEHVTFETLHTILLNPTTPAHQLGLRDTENKCGRSTQMGGGGGSSRSRAVSFSDITNRGKQLTLTAGTERRSRRPAKRRMDDDFEYEQDVHTAKKAAQSGSGQPSRLGSKFGIRGPSAASALPAAGMASESCEEVPLDEGVRSVGLPGHLQCIELINFMCHAHFTMEFGPHVTFVSGTNGSGKSAVLQALQCCLGVKASQTGRAPNFKHFIRTGTDEAIVRVTLYNRPYKDYDAFQHELYGDTITVERRIARVGTASAYFLKDESGRVQSRRRDDLDALLQTLGINAANPVTVMTQDTARSFLAGSSAAADREKWALYMDATQLSQIRYNLELSRAQIRLMDESVHKIKEEYEEMEREHEGLAKAIEALRGLEVWRCEIGQYEQVLTWTLVDEHEKSAAALQSALSTLLPQRLAEAEQRAGELHTQYGALKQSADEKEQFLLSYTHRAKEVSAEAEQLKARRADTHRVVVAARRKLTHLQRKLQEETSLKESLLAAVQETTNEMAADSQAVMLAYRRELEEVDRSFKGVEAQAEEAAEAKARADAELQAAMEEEARVKQDQHSNSTQVKRIIESLQQVQLAKRNKLSKFGGAEMVELVRLIQRSKGRFHRPPVGPVGHYLALNDSKWARAVEVAVGLNLNAFLVSDLHDCRLLQQLVRQAGLKGWKQPSVTAVKFDLPVYNVPASVQPNPRVPTVLRVLSCNHPQQSHTILNFLIDAAHIERAALCENHQEGKRLGWDTPNVNACFGLDGSKYYRRGQSQTNLGPPHWVKFQPLRLCGDEVEQGRGLQEELRQLQQEAQLLDQELALASQRVQAAGEAARAARIASAQLYQQVFRVKTRLGQLMSQPPPEVAATQAAAGGSAEDEVQREILDATQAVVDLEQQLGEKQREVEEAERAEAEAGEAFLSKKQEMDRLADENAQFVSTWQADVEQVNHVGAELKTAQEQHQALLRQTAHLEQQLAKQQEGLGMISEMAVQLCSRVMAEAAKGQLAAGLREKEGMDEAKLEKWFTTNIMRKKIERLQKKIAEHERQAGGTMADLEVKFEVVQAKMDSDGRRFESAIGAYNLMTTALDRRFDKLAKLFRTVSEAVNKRFNHYMARKGHLGSIKLDKDNQTLQLKVQIGGKSGEGGGKVKDLKQLSGGERSFTTVAFTLALGAQTDMPFRAIDEYDVFMDAINRRVAMENLLTFAKENDDLQFIFLTPQDIAAVEDARQGCARLGQALPDGFIKVVQMRPARANATQA